MCTNVYVVNYGKLILPMFEHNINISDTSSALKILNRVKYMGHPQTYLPGANIHPSLLNM
jgi:hypothetical protein